MSAADPDELRAAMRAVADGLAALPEVDAFSAEAAWQVHRRGDAELALSRRLCRAGGGRFRPARDAAFRLCGIEVESSGGLAEAMREWLRAAGRHCPEMQEEQKA